MPSNSVSSCSETEFSNPKCVPKLEFGNRGDSQNASHTNRLVQLITVGMHRLYLSNRKAVEHHRTPKRKRNYRVRIGGRVLECGSVLPLLNALVGLRCARTLD